MQRIEQKKKDLKENFKKSLADFLEAMFISLAIVGLVFWLIGQPLKITGDSMYPTYVDGEQIIAEKLTYNFQSPVRGDVVILKHPDTKGAIAIKRVIGEPFDRILIQDGQIFINGELYEEPYLNNVTTEGMSKIKDSKEFFVQEDSFVLLGDNRDDSLDSRVWGAIKRESIIGKPILVYLPRDNFRLVL